MKEREFNKFCKILNIYISPNQSIDEKIKGLKGYLKMFFADKAIPEKCQEWKRDFQEESLEGKTKEEQKDILLDLLICSKYAYCRQNAVAIIQRKRNSLGDNIVHIKDENEEIEEFKKKLDAYYKAYMGEIKSAEEFLENRMNIFMKRQEKMGQLVTHLPENATIEMLQSKQKENQEKNPQFKDFSGTPYRWAVDVREMNTKEEMESCCLKDIKNEKKERMIVMRLGKFEYDKLSRGASTEFPEGQYGQMRRRRHFWRDEIRCE